MLLFCHLKPTIPNPATQPTPTSKSSLVCRGPTAWDFTSPTPSSPSVGQVLAPALVTQLDELSTLNTVFTHYSGCGWLDVFCTTGNKKKNAMLTSTESLVPDLLLFSYSISTMAVTPTPVQHSHNKWHTHLSFVLSCTLGNLGMYTQSQTFW